MTKTGQWTDNFLDTGASLKVTSSTQNCFMLPRPLDDRSSVNWRGQNFKRCGACLQHLFPRLLTNTLWGSIAEPAARSQPPYASGIVNNKIHKVFRCVAFRKRYLQDVNSESEVFFLFYFLIRFNNIRDFTHETKCLQPDLSGRDRRLSTTRRDRHWASWLSLWTWICTYIQTCIWTERTSYHKVINNVCYYFEIQNCW